MATTSAEKAYEKYAWILLFVPGLFLAVLSLLPLVGGYEDLNSPSVITAALLASTPSITQSYLNEVARSAGLSGLFAGVLIAGIAGTSYRKGQRLAWYLMLLFFIDAVATTLLGILGPLPGIGFVQNNLLGFILVIVSAMGIFLPFRKFFPKEESQGSKFIMRFADQ